MNAGLMVFMRHKASKLTKGYRCTKGVGRTYHEMDGTKKENTRRV